VPGSLPVTRIRAVPRKESSGAQSVPVSDSSIRSLTSAEPTVVKSRLGVVR
jgi:hypothetical protein